MGLENLSQAEIDHRILCEVERAKQFVKCRLCCNDFSVSRSGFNNIISHLNGIINGEKLREAESSPSITIFIERTSPSIFIQV